MRFATALLLGALILTTHCFGAVRDSVPLAYVACAGGNHIQVIDLTSGETLRRIYAGATPWRLVVSADARRLLAQHWYAGTTAVIDLATHEILGLLPVRGPGLFAPGNQRFLSFHWPESTLNQFDLERLERVSERVTEAKQVYSVAVSPDGKELYLAQYNPMGGRGAKIYAYILAYPYANGKDVDPVPVSIRTGRSPRAIRALVQHPFLLTADSGTNGLSLLNRRKAGRAVPTCPAPIAVLTPPDESRMVVACWQGRGKRTSQVISYATDFSQRPWPSIQQQSKVTIEGGIVAGTFSPTGDRLYFTDRSGGRLLELDPATLKLRRSFATGDEPVDVVVVEVPVAAQDRLLAGPSQARRRVLETLTQLGAASSPFTDATWTEISRWLEPVADNHPASDEAKTQESGKTEPRWIEHTRRSRRMLALPARLRSETEEGHVRLAAGGHSVTLDDNGRFWVTPRQELLATVLSLQNLEPDEAVKQLAGHVTGSPFLRAGIAVDLVTEVERDGSRTLVIGAPAKGARTAQLWLDCITGQPLNLVEQFPSFRSGGHHGSGAAGVVETRFAESGERPDGHWFPTSLLRRVNGEQRVEVTIEDVAFDRGLQDELFSLARLGGIGPATKATVIQPAKAQAASDGPGLAVPIIPPGDYLSGPGAPHAPYNSSPPTSGPRLREIADWGAHEIPIPLELVVHNLELGGVALQYNCPRGCPELIAKLTEVALAHEHVLISPYPLVKTRIALSAWGRIDTFDDFDAERIEAFIAAYLGKNHRGGGKADGL